MIILHVLAFVTEEAMKQDQGRGLSVFPLTLCSHAPSLVTEKAREGGTGENSAVLYGQQAYSASLFPTFSFFLSFPFFKKKWMLRSSQRNLK